nr:hypothetical protein Iba_chr03aCG0680 [Ipomoea batatas]
MVLWLIGVSDGLVFGWIGVRNASHTRNVRGEAGGDRGVVHFVVECGGLNGHFPQLHGLLFGETPRPELRSAAIHFQFGPKSGAHQFEPEVCFELLGSALLRLAEEDDDEKHWIGVVRKQRNVAAIAEEKAEASGGSKNMK